MRTSSRVEAAGLAGGFHVRAVRGPDGATVIAEQAVSTPFHLSKPYWTGEVLIVQCVNATAGVFAGDRLEMSVEAEPGARVLLTSPSAHRVHTMKAGCATMEQRLRVAAGGWLELRPELFIPQAGCVYRQDTVVDVEPGGELFFAETLAPGRRARGECFAFREVAWSLDLRRGGEPLARERYTLRRDDASTWSLRHPFAEGYYAGCYLVSDRADRVAGAQAAVHALADDRRLVGMTRLAPACWAFKMLAADSETLRGALADLRGLLAPQFPSLAADAWKL